jgi:hypothetical protein
MREKVSKGERGTREVLEIFHSASPLLTFFLRRLFRSTELFGPPNYSVSFSNKKQQHSVVPNYSVYHRIIRWPTELFGSLPNYSVHRIILPPYRDCTNDVSAVLPVVR